MINCTTPNQSKVRKNSTLINQSKLRNSKRHAITANIYDMLEGEIIILIYKVKFFSQNIFVDTESQRIFQEV